MMGYQTVTYFSVFKLWFTLRASPSDPVPSLPILLRARLLKRIIQS